MHFLIMNCLVEILSLNIKYYYENLVFLPSVQPKVMFGKSHGKEGVQLQYIIFLRKFQS